MGIDEPISPDSLAAINSAIVQADAAIKAAQLTADATIHGAWVQGCLTVLAGLLALVGASFAYQGALRQVRLAEAQHAARLAAYRFRMRSITAELRDNAVVAFSEAKIRLRDFEGHGGHYVIWVPPLEKDPIFNDENWELHALLGEQCVGNHKFERTIDRL